MQSRPCLVSDVDGVLADTRPLVLKAYELAGVDPALVQWGAPWEEWLPAAVGGSTTAALAVHHEKNKHYEDLVENHLSPLTAAHALRQLRGEYDLWFLTGASPLAARAVLVTLGFRPRFLGTGCTTEQKVWALIQHGSYGAYIDDNRELGEYIARLSGWAFLSYDPRLTADDVVAQVRAALMGDD